MNDDMLDRLMRSNHEPRHPPAPAVTPHTAAMDRALDRLPDGTQVIGVQLGLPLIRMPDGRRVVLTTTGQLQRT